MATIGPLEVGLLGLLAFIFGLDYIWVTPLGIWRPVVAGTLTGIILGDPLTGLLVGSLLEFVFAGLFTIGGGTVPEAASGTIASVVVAVTTGLKPEAAVPLAIPVAVLTMNLEIVVRSFDAVFTHWADREIERGNYGAIPLINILGAVPWGLSRAIPIWLFAGALAINPQAVKAAIDALQVVQIGPFTVRFWDAMAVAGAVLPALGAAILMKLMISRRNVMFFVLGFALAAYLKLSLLAIALVAGSIIFAIYYFTHREALEAGAAVTTAAPPTGKATTKDFIRWFGVSWFIQSSWNYERMMGTGFAHGMLEIEKKLRKDPEELKSWMRLHNEFYNTEPHLHNAIYGMVISLEEQGADQDTIRGVKTALMGPFAGLGDSIMWFTILPIAFLLGASLGAQGNILGPVIALLIWIPVSWAVKYYTLVYGYKYGLSLAEILKGEVLKIFREGIAAFAMAMVGGIAATYVRATTPIVLAQYAGHAIKLQPVLDQLMPSLLPLLFTLYAYWLIKVKGYSYGKAVVILFLTAFILALLGVLG
ncbi:PTS system mannose/fructose/sorbose family transporter subunit IID [Thermofilum pendens]|uniref:PTS system mannose/fructose/sorbose family IID component n=1 Tax=Thermofilum pendens (strain DSM 2475 / Hrk 5) TaxID=368408 RepID=A1RZ69_THEPD|nr:PTS system mannose/fructose/sorbose family transporter subunit IID [Thermofilum pendens]ABL78499.1 PTS system mannose/fructose/sorbose family IID component [Thermofilum pendens Hrk 5]